MWILAILLSTFYFTMQANCDNYDGNLIQISCSNKNNQILKALLVPCPTSHSKCISHVEIRGWLNANEKRETFLLIDEVFDLKEQINLPLLHPYLIRVSASETIASFPLNLEEIVDVSCSGNDMKRREAYQHGHDGNLNEDFFQQTAQNYNNLLNAIKEEEVAIKKDIQNFVPRDNGTSVRNEHDLLLYFEDDDDITKMQPKVNLKNDENVQRQHENKGKLKAHEIKFKMPFSSHDVAHVPAFNHFNPNRNNYQLKFSGFPNEMANTTDQNANGNSENYNYVSQQSPNSRTNNRFSINQHQFGENVRTTGVINHHHYDDLLGHDTRDQAMKSSMNENSDYVPNVIDVRVKIGNQEKHIEPGKFAADSQRNENQLSSFAKSQNDKSTAMNYKFSFDDNRTIPIDLSIKASSAFMNERNDSGDDDDDDEDEAIFSARKDNEEMNENLSMASSAGHHHQPYNSNSNKNNEIDSTEDDINTLIKNESSIDDMHENENENADLNRFRRNIDETTSTNERLRAQKYSVYKLDSPMYGNEMKIQIFRMKGETWVKIHPTVELSSTIKNYQNESFLIELNEKSDHLELFDRSHMRLLTSNDKDPQEHSIMDLKGDKIENLNDKIKKSFCGINEKQKRSIINLRETDLMPTNENVITKCPTALNADRNCLNLRDNDAITWRLNVVIPFQHNEMLDKRLPFVKISSIYIDTSDGINMFAQFEITSMDHFTRYFNLSLSHCDILEHLNISHSFELPPGMSEVVNITMAVPFYTIQYKDQKCKVNIMAIGRNDNVIVAQRDFQISPKNKRCLCLWMCSCFCFDYFLTVESKDLCKTMSTRNEIYAGFVDDKNYDEDVDDDVEFLSGMISRKLLMLLPFMVMLIVLMMGCIKAILGCCFRQIDIWKFNHVQSCKPYRDSGRCWKIFVNTIFFFLLPIVWCTKCCTIGTDEKIDSDKSFYIKRSVVRKEGYSDEDDDDDEEDGDVEKWKLLRPNIPSSEYSSIFEQHKRSSETVFNVTNLPNPFDDSSNQSLYDDDEMFAKDTEFVVNAINESHESLRKLVKPSQRRNHRK
ncbi:hypothetical protein ACKWTF_011329 [Chironomus riparius]